MRKPVFGVLDQVCLKLGFTATEDGQRLEISDFRSRREVKTSAFVYEYAKFRFSHDGAHLFILLTFNGSISKQ